MNSSQRRKQKRGIQRNRAVQHHSYALDSGGTSTPDVQLVAHQATEILPHSEYGLQTGEIVLSTRQRAARRLPYWCVILFVPLTVLCAQINPLFTPPGYIDPWVYLGFFRNFSNFEAALFPNTYYGSRLSWVLPGLLIHHIFPPVIAASVLHLLVYFVALFSFYYVITTTIGRRTALLSSIVFGLYPFFWNAIGWDYVDGVGIAYYLLTTALLTKAASTKSHRLALMVAGVGFWALLYSNIVWILFTPVLLVHYLGLMRPMGMRQWRNVIVGAFLWSAVGALGLTLILCIINHSVGGGFWFYRPSVMYALRTFGQKNPWYVETHTGALPSPWLWFPILTLLLGIAAYLLRLLVRWEARGGRAIALYTLELLIASTVLVYLQMHGSPLLGLFFYASYLIPLVFLAAAPLFWRAAEELTIGWFAMAVLAVIPLDAAGWWVPATSCIIQWSRPENYVFIPAALVALLGAMLFRRPRQAIALSIVGFSLLNLTVSTGRSADTNANERAYQRVMNARAIVEQVRGLEVIRWWYNDTEPNAADFTAISSTYLWGYTLIGLQFPNLTQKPVLPTPCVLAVISSRQDTAETAILALTPVLEQQHLTATLKRVSVIQDQHIHYTLALMQIDKNISIQPQVGANHLGGAHAR